MNLNEVWVRLEEDQRATPETGRMQRRIIPEHPRDFFLGLELPTRNRMLILRVSSASVVEHDKVPDSHGLKVRIFDRDTTPPTSEIALILTDHNFQSIFDFLIEDLVDAAESQKEEQASVNKFLERLSDWQLLLMTVTPGVMTKEHQQGLWGELWVLREIIGPAIGFCDGISCWRGPFGADQDFQFNHAAIEVKTSAAQPFNEAEIANERQLGCDSDISLLLIALSLDARPHSGLTLPELVNNVRSQASSAGCLRMLEERLALYGFRDCDTDNYSETGYRVRSRQQFKVREDFPRLVPSDLRPGVSDVRYSIDLIACSRFITTDEELIHLLRGTNDDARQ